MRRTWAAIDEARKEDKDFLVQEIHNNLNTVIRKLGGLELQCRALQRKRHELRGPAAKVIAAADKADSILRRAAMDWEDIAFGE